jgi:hypothetical protein
MNALGEVLVRDLRLFLISAADSGRLFNDRNNIGMVAERQ